MKYQFLHNFKCFYIYVRYINLVLSDGEKGFSMAFRAQNGTKLHWMSDQIMRVFTDAEKLLLLYFPFVELIALGWQKGRNGSYS